MATRTKLTLFSTSVILLIAIAIKNVENLDQSCPPDGIICPCTCYEAGILANIQCMGITEQDTLMRVLHASSAYQCKGFDLVQSNIQFIPASIFNTEKPTKILVMLSTLASLFDRPPSVENDLKILMLNKVQLSNGLQWEMFSGFKKLHFLTLLDTLVDKIDKSFTTYAPEGIEMLALYNCSVSELDDFAFAKMVNLTELYVQHGTIKELKRSMFPTPSKLEKLDLKGHRIGFLPEDIFSDMPNLIGIDLSDNALAAFSQTTFGSVCPNLQFVEVDDNPIICGCNIRWITKVLAKYPNFRIDGMCSDPKELKGRLLSDLKEDDFKYCDCLDNTNA